MNLLIYLKRFIFDLACLGCAALLVACASPDTRRAPAPLTEFKSVLKLKQVWRAEVGKAQGYLFQPIVVGTAVYTAAANGTVVKIDAARGVPIWRTRLDAGLSAGVGSDGKLTAVGGVDGKVYVLGQEGALLWSKPLKGEIITPPWVGQGFVIARTNDGRITAFEAYTGTRMWTFRHDVPPLSVRTTEEIILMNPEHILAGFSDGTLAALRITDGAAQWHIPLSYPHGVTESERLNDVVGAPVQMGREICAVTFQGSIGCVDLHTGRVLWKHSFSSDVGLARQDATLVGVDDHSVISRFDLPQRSPVWQNAQLKNRRLSRPVIAGLAMAVGDYKGFVHFLSLGNGELIARMPTDGSAMTASPVLAGRLLIVQTQHGRLYAFEPD